MGGAKATGYGISKNLSMTIRRESASLTINCPTGYYDPKVILGHFKLTFF